MAVLTDLPYECLVRILDEAVPLLSDSYVDRRWRVGYSIKSFQERFERHKAMQHRWLAGLATVCKALHAPSQAFLYRELAIPCPSCRSSVEKTTTPGLFQSLDANQDLLQRVQAILIYACHSSPPCQWYLDPSAHTTGRANPHHRQWDTRLATLINSLPNKLRKFGFYDYDDLGLTLWTRTREAACTKTQEVIHFGAKDSGILAVHFPVLRVSPGNLAWEATRLIFGQVRLKGTRYPSITRLTHLTVTDCYVNEEDLDRLLATAGDSLVKLELQDRSFGNDISPASWFARIVKSRPNAINNLVTLDLLDRNCPNYRREPAENVGLINTLLKACPQMTRLRAPNFTATAALFEKDELARSQLQHLVCGAHEPGFESVKRLFSSERRRTLTKLFLVLVPNQDFWEEVDPPRLLLANCAASFAGRGQAARDLRRRKA